MISGGDADTRTSLAWLIHKQSDRCGGPFVVVGRGQDPEQPGPEPSPDLICKSTGGTLFIEELSALDRNRQLDLLKILASHADDSETALCVRETRVIAATGSNLIDQVASDAFRADLFYQLNTVHVILREQPAGPQQPSM